MIAELLADALEAKGFPREAVSSFIESTDREATGELMKLRGIVDDHSTWRCRPDPALRARVACAGDRDGHGQLPHLRA